MWDFVHKKRKAIQLVLAITFLPFAFFGIGSRFSNFRSGNEVAKVGPQRITREEFSRALQQRQSALQRMLGNKADWNVLNRPELRFGVLDAMIKDRLLTQQAARDGVTVPDAELRQLIAAQPAFENDGKFSEARYEEFLKRRGETPAAFENGLRSDLELQQVNAAYAASGFVPNTVVNRLLRISGQQREVSDDMLKPDDFKQQVRLDVDAAKKYYASHPDEFKAPEQARVQYVVLSLAALAAQVKLTPQGVRDYYEQNSDRYRDEERRVSQILIAVAPDAAPQAKQAARVKAASVLKQAQANPSGFAELAKRYSDDAGSAPKGGDLGLMPRGVLPQPLDQAVSRMKVGEIAGPIATQYGYHIVRLDGIKTNDFNAAKAAVEKDLRHDKASKKFNALAERFGDQLFEHADSLKPAAQALNLPIQESRWLSRNGGNHAIFDNRRLLDAIFSADAVKDKRNTKPVAVGSDMLVAARVIDHKPATVRPFDEVKADINERLTHEKAVQLAAQHGRELLAQLKAGQRERIKWSAPEMIGRGSRKYAAPVLGKIFKADVGKLPAYTGVKDSQGDFLLLKITKVVEPAPVDAARRKQADQQLGQLAGREELDAYVDALKNKANVKVNPQFVERQTG